MRKARILLLALLAVLPATSASSFEAPLPMDEAFQLNVTRDAGRLTLNWSIASGYYLYRSYIVARDPTGKPVGLETPAGRTKDDPGFGAVEIYYDKAKASAINPPSSLAVTYQGCQEGGLCYPPTTKTIDTATLSISEGGERQTESFAPAKRTEPEFLPASRGPEADFQLASGNSQTQIDRLLSDGGLILMLGGFLGFGLLLSFTPCVFPMYPIVAAMLSRQGDRLTAGRGFVLSGAYVLALAAAFGLLGMLAAWSGQNMQIALQSPISTGAIAGLFIVLALSSFGLFSIQLPAAIGRLVSARPGSGGNIGAAIVLGFSSALLIGPCVTAPLAGALLYIARTGDVLTGAMALSALGLGKGIPLIVMATFGGGAMPRAGAWMEKVRQLFGFLFLATAIYIAAPLMGDRTTMLLWAMIALSFGTFAGAFSLRIGGGSPLARSVAVISVLWGSLLLAGFGMGATDPLTPLGPLRAVNAETRRSIDKADFAKVASAGDLSKLLDRSSEGQTPVLVYVTADWCITCRGIERNLLPDADVVTALDGVRLAALDVSQLDPDRRTLMKALGAAGPPTMIFFDGARREVEGTRLVGEFSAEELSSAALRAKGQRP